MSSSNVAVSDTFKVMLQLQSFTVLTASFNGIMLWEVITCFPAEAKFIFGPELKRLLRQGKLPPLTSLLLFNARVLVIPLAAVSFALISPIGVANSSNFEILFETYMYLFSACVFNGTAVFVRRTLAIRDSEMAMTVFLWCCYAIICIFHLICAALLKMPSNFLYLSSHNTPLDQYLTWILFIGCSIIFDIIILGLSIEPQMKGLKWTPTYSRIAKTFYFDAIMYFLISLITSTFEMSWIIAHRKDGLIIGLASPIHIWLMLTISPRVIRNLRLYSAKEQTSLGLDLFVEGVPLEEQLLKIGDESSR